MQSLYGSNDVIQILLILVLQARAFNTYDLIRTCSPQLPVNVFKVGRASPSNPRDSPHE